MKHTNKMVNIEFNPLNGSSFMNDLRNKYMEKQTAVEWLVENLHLHNDVYFVTKDKRKIIEQAKEMEKEQILKAYEDGYYGDVVKHEDEFKNYYTKNYGDK
jgi:phosphoribosylaminoimidazole carboxylase (NCAIR synthetase)